MKVGVDFGGSLIKICGWMAEDDVPAILRLFDATDLTNSIEFLKDIIADKKVQFYLTGGGAIKNSSDLISSFPPDCKVYFIDEMKALAHGLPFCLSDPAKFPLLLVNIGSGVSILKVTAGFTFTRISGTSLGGATFTGLGRLLTGIVEYDKLQRLAAAGSRTSSDVDLTVGDIYGGDYKMVGLNADVVASSFGGISKKVLAKSVKHENILFSLLQMISFNIAQIAALNCTAQGISNVYVFGGFTESSELARDLLREGIKYWSKDTVEVGFGKNSIFLGCIGAILSSSDTDKR